MTEVMRVDAVGLRDCEPAFGHLSVLVDETLRRLADRLDAEGECWGGDETGVAFRGAYWPAATTVREAIPGLRDGVASVGASLLVAADNVDAAETRTAYRFG
jgi:hypothetical protein